MHTHHDRTPRTSWSHRGCLYDDPKWLISSSAAPSVLKSDLTTRRITSRLLYEAKYFASSAHLVDEIKISHEDVIGKCEALESNNLYHALRFLRAPRRENDLVVNLAKFYSEKSLEILQSFRQLYPSSELITDSLINSPADVRDEIIKGWPCLICERANHMKRVGDFIDVKGTLDGGFFISVIMKLLIATIDEEKTPQVSATTLFLVGSIDGLELLFPARNFVFINMIKDYAVDGKIWGLVLIVSYFKDLRPTIPGFRYSLSKKEDEVLCSTIVPILGNREDDSRFIRVFLIDIVDAPLSLRAFTHMKRNTDVRLVRAYNIGLYLKYDPNFVVQNLISQGSNLEKYVMTLLNASPEIIGSYSPESCFQISQRVCP